MNDNIKSFNGSSIDGPFGRPPLDFILTRGGCTSNQSPDFMPPRIEKSSKLLSNQPRGSGQQDSLSIQVFEIRMTLKIPNQSIFSCSKHSIQSIAHVSGSENSTQYTHWEFVIDFIVHNGASIFLDKSVHMVPRPKGTLFHDILKFLWRLISEMLSHPSHFDRTHGKAKNSLSPIFQCFVSTNFFSYFPRRH